MLYMEQYLDNLQLLPGDLQRKLRLLRDLDQKAQKHLESGDKLTNSFMVDAATVNKDERKKMYEEIRSHYQKAKMLGDEKVQLAIQTYEMVDKHIRRLDSELAKFEGELKRTILKQQQQQKPCSSLDAVGGSSAAARNSPLVLAGSSASTEQQQQHQRQEKSSSWKKTSSATLEQQQQQGLQQQQQQASTSGLKKRKAKEELESKKQKKNKKSGVDNKLQQEDDNGEEESLTGSQSGLNLMQQFAAGIGAADVLDMPIDPNEPVYCVCRQVSYGQMIGCDNPDCPIEWFHFNCVGLTNKPKGKWFCSACAEEKKKSKN